MKPEKQLYQWDVNQYLTELQPTAEFVDYQMGNEVIRIKADGTRCRIPDEVLQTYGGKTCYERYPDGTYRAYSFTVLYAPKPPDYVYTPEERTTFEALTARVDAAIEEIKRRADSGEFTPKKGVDYFTDAEKAEMMESVSDGAIGEFRNVVDTATTEYNANATEKLTTYNRNAEQKLESYNSNHTEKLTEYNTNAETKTAEFDANAAALQTEVDRLRGECDQLAEENRKQENRISALMKLNKGQTYDVLYQESEAYSVDVSSGAKYVGIDKVGGKSVVWNQQIDTSKAKLLTSNGVTLSRKENGKLYISGTAAGETSWHLVGIAKLVQGHKYIAKKLGENVPLRFDNLSGNFALKFDGELEVKTLTEEAKIYAYAQIIEGVTVNTEIDPFLIDLTLMFGDGNEPTAEQFEAMFPEYSYKYNPGEIISSRTETITAGAETITTGFPVLNSAGSVYDYIDLNEGKHRQRVGVVDLGTIDWEQGGNNNKTSWVPISWRTNVKPVQHTNDKANILCNKYCTDTANHVEGQVNDKTISVNRNSWVYIYDSAYISVTPQEFKEAMSGVMLYYELAEEIITDIEIPTELSDWLTVEAGGSVTFHNADETKQLAVPNAVSWVRKLDEVN